MINKLKCSLFTNKKYIDCLTNLPNREQLLIDIKSHNKTLYLINIDGFKEINEFYGNEFGNFILKEIASDLLTLLNSNLNKKVFNFYKLPADEYAILLLKYVPEEEILFYSKKNKLFF